MIEINARLSIPEDEIRFAASRSSGPGGQHVNKASTRLTLQFDVRNSPSLTDVQKRRVLSRLATRINKDGVLQLHSQRHRSQSANRDDLIERFATLLRKSLERRAPRKKTRPTREARERRLADKKRRGRLKQKRSGGIENED